MKYVDMHCDTITELWYARKAGKLARLLHNSLHIDLERLQVGDYLLQNFAMFVNMMNRLDPFEAVLQLIELFYRELEQYPDRIGVVRSYRDIERNIKEGRMSALLTVEEGGVCKGSLENLRELYLLGVRMMTLTWNYENELAYPNCSYEEATKDFQFYPNTEQGLKEKGYLFVEEMERLGIIIDVSHLSDAGFYDVYRNTKKPFVASHSNARALCNHSRNLTDDMIRKLGERGGVIGLNYNPDFLRPQVADGERTVDLMAKHLRHLIHIGGLECVGLGSDFDGITETPELPDCSKVYLLEEALARQGFHQSELDAILHNNVLRIYKELL